MPAYKNLRPLLRATLILGSVGVITTAATFASLQSQQAVLSANTVESATADLRIGTSSTSFSASRTGFDFNSVTPGGPAAPASGNTIYLKNYGTANLAVKAAISSTPSNLNNINLSKIYIHFQRVDTGGTDQSLSIKSLMDSYATGGSSLNDTILAGATAQYSLKVSMDADAFSGSSATISGIDLVFTGLAN